MASDKLLRDPKWIDPDIKWYISSKPVKRILGKSGTAPAGTIFQVDYEASQLDEKLKKEIVLKSCHKGVWKVKWAPQTFYGLDDDSKDLLLALSDQNDRLRFYLASQASLQYGKTLEKYDDVCVRLPKRKEMMIGGVVKYKGPVDEECSAIWFGVELVSNCGDTDGVFKKTGLRYFTCEQGRGQFVTIKNIMPTSVSEEEKQKLFAHGKKDKDASGRSSDAATNIGVSDISQTPFIRVGDEVMLRTQMERGGKPQLVVGHVVLVHGEHVAVNVVESETPVFKPWNGHFKDDKIYHDANKQTVLLKLNEVELTYSHSSSTASCKEKEDEFKNSTAVLKNMPQTNVWERSKDGMTASSVNANCRDQMQKNVQETNNIHGTSRVTTSQPHSLGSLSTRSDVSMSHSRVSSSPPVEMLGKSDREVTRSDSFDDSAKSSAAGRTLKSQESKGNKFNFKSMMSNIPGLPGFSRAGPPAFPLKDFHIDALSKDRDIVEILVTELEVNEKWKEICRHENSDYFRVDLFLKWWWSNHIREGYKEEFRRFTDILAKNGREDLRDHINEVPDFGTFDKTVIVALTSSVDKEWPHLASELGLKQQEVNERITKYMKSHECIQNVLQMWQEKEPGCRKLYQLVGACRTLKLTTLADDIEQGLSETVLKRIARRIEKGYFEKLGSHLEVSWIRRDAIKLKFRFLSDGIFHMLCWWSMRQPFNVDKAEKLCAVLEECKLESIAAEELSRGIEKDDLEATAIIIKDNWKNIAPYLLSSRDIDYLSKYDDDLQKILNMFGMWKRRQPFDGLDLKEVLYSHLIDCEMYKAARLLYDGLDNGTLIHLSRKLCFEWSLLANHFGYDREEISKRLSGSNQAEMSLIFLKECIKTNKKTKAELFDGLKAIGREDLVMWMHKRAEEDVEEDLQKSIDKKPDLASQPKKLDRIVMEGVVSAISRNVDANSFMSILNLEEEDVQKFLPKSVRKSEVKRHFAILCSWKKKQLSEGRGESECFKLLGKILTMYEQHTAAAALTDGSPVDPEEFGSQGGAAGGASVLVHRDLNVNSMVEVTWGGKTLPGVIQWIGVVRGLEEHGKIAGVELEEFAEVGATSGKFGHARHFSCQYGRGLFIPLSRCRPDSRFLTETETYTPKEKMEKEDFGNIECDPVDGYVKPPETVKKEHIGIFKGIQGDHNSCYMDVTLYSMFAFSDLFDAILQYTATAKTETKKVKDALRETIVNPLRSHGVVRADHVLRFRDLLSLLSSMEGFRTEEKDPEEFIHALLQELLNAKPFLKISQGKNDIMESFVYQIFTDKKKYLDIPTVEDLLHVSFLESDLKLSEVPDCFIVQLPRYGKKYKLYDWIIPSLEMDISLLIRGSPRPCNACGKLAFMECLDCIPEYEEDDIIQSFCGDCFPTLHQTSKKQHHNSNPLPIPKSFVETYQQKAKEVEEEQIATETENLYEKRVMELFSVVCIETSHYVAFVKTGSGEHAQWVFFDSMADRRGDQHGYNVPEVSHLRDFEAQMRREDLKNALKGREELPKYLKRLLSDAYICFYRPTKSGSGISPKGRIKRPTGGREQNVQEEACSAGTNHSQPLYENLSKNSGQHHGGGHYPKDDNIDKSHEGMDASKTNHSSQKTPREKHRERKQDSYSPLTTEYPTPHTRPVGTSGTFSRNYVMDKECYFSHYHQSGEKNLPNTSTDVPMEIDNVAGEVSNPAYAQIPDEHASRGKEGHEGMEKQLDHHYQHQTGTMHSSDNSYGDPMETGDPPNQASGYDSHHHHQHERESFTDVSKLEEGKSSKKKIFYTPDYIKKQTPQFSSHAQLTVNQHQRRDVDQPLPLEASASDEDTYDSLSRDYVVVRKPEDTSLAHTDADSSARSDFVKYQVTNV